MQAHDCIECLEDCDCGAEPGDGCKMCSECQSAGDDEAEGNQLSSFNDDGTVNYESEFYDERLHEGVPFDDGDEDSFDDSDEDL